MAKISTSWDNSKPKNDTSSDFSDDSEKHSKRIERMGAHKLRTLGMLDYLFKWEKLHDIQLNEFQKFRYSSCHHYLHFRQYTEIKKTKLHAAKHCDIHLLCPMCAIRRAAKAVMRYKEKCAALLSQNPKLRLYYLVLTVKNDASLDDSFNHLEKSMRLLIKRRREAITFQKNGSKQLTYAADSVFAHTTAGSYSIEVKRGTGSGLWHPHVNLLVLSSKPIRKDKVIAEWSEVTGDSFIVECLRVKADTNAFVEIFKYALKFSDMEFEDNYYAWERLRGRRLCGSFGDFRGLEVERDVDETELGEYIDLFYRFGGRNYIKVEEDDF